MRDLPYAPTHETFWLQKVNAKVGVMEGRAAARGHILNKLIKHMTSWNRDAEHFPTDRPHLDLCALRSDQGSLD